VIRPSAEVTVYLCVAPVDMRKQASGLALLVEQSLGGNVFEGVVFGFANARRDRIKLLVWERNGLVLWSKRLERDRFVWPSRTEATVSLTGRELNALLDGFDVFTRGHRALVLRHVG
jgi:transposase